MLNIRFPLKKPTSGHPNPYTIDFDFLPYPLVYPLTPDQAPFIYTTKISINDPDPGSARIEHVFPKGKVYFVIDESLFPNFQNDILTITDGIINNTFNGTFQGIWMHIGNPGAIKSIRGNSSLASPFIPVSVIYNSIVIDAALLQQIKALIQNQHFKYNIRQPDEKVISPVTPTNQKIIISDWLKGKIGIDITENDIASANISLPLCSVVNTKKQLQVGAIMIDYNGVEKESCDALISILKQNVIAGKLFDTNTYVNHSNGKVARIVPLPLNSFLENAVGAALVPGDLINHPYRTSYNIPFNASIWDVVVFYNGVPREIANTTKKFFDIELIVKVDGSEFPLLGNGIFYFQDIENKSIQLLNKNTLEQYNLYIVSNTLTQGITLNLLSSFRRQNYYSVGFTLIQDIVLPDNSDQYFGIPRSMDNIKKFLDTITPLYQTKLSTAGCFARTMGFLAEAVANYLKNDNHKYTVLENLEFLLSNNQSFTVFIHTCYEIFFDDANKEPFFEIGYNPFNFFNHMPTDFKDILSQINTHYLSNIKNLEWLKTHGDHNSGDATEGWKNFGYSPDGGHKHHFIANALLVVRHNVGSAPIDIIENFDVFGVEDVPIDREYNEAGRSFGYWGCLRVIYNPSEVYCKIMELIVRNEYVNDSASNPKYCLND
ncbi:MAG: hypothetical protein QM768_21595 [Agriterribacter sp.]